MSGPSSKISSSVFAARDVCRALELRSNKLSRVARQLWNRRIEIKSSDYSKISVELARVPGMPKMLSNDNIIRLLNEENLASKLAGNIDKTDISSKLLNINNILKKLPVAKDTSEIWNIYAGIITGIMGTGGAVYAINDQGEIENRGRPGLVGGSRYTNWMKPKGEKAQMIYIFDVVTKLRNASTGQMKDEYEKILKFLRFWHIEDRRVWPMFGLDRDILQQALDDSGSDQLEAGIYKPIADKVIQNAFANKKRIENSENYLKERGMAELFRIINKGDDSFAIFKQTMCNYAEALQDIEGDKQRLSEQKSYPIPEDCLKENVYYLIHDSNFKNVALVLANRHEESINAGIKRRLFPSVDKKEDLLDLLNEINTTLALALRSRMMLKELEIDNKELDRGKEQADELLNLSNIMNDEALELNDRLDRAAEKLQILFKKSEEAIHSSIMLLSREHPDEMEVVATTRGELTTRSVNIKEPDKISGWVAQIQKPVFVAAGYVYIGDQNPMSDNALKELKRTNPELYREIERIIDDVDNTFMTVPLISGNELLGVVNVRGAKLTEKDMMILKSASVNLSLAVKNSLQAKELKKSAEKFKALSIRDSRTGFYNLAYFDAKMEKEFKLAKEQDHPLSIITLDLINFRDYNNKADHATGNYALTSFAENMRRFNTSLSRSEEDRDLEAMLKDLTIARLGGGDEFGILMPNTSITKAFQYAKELEKFTHENPVRFEKGPFSGQSRIIFFRAGVAAYNDPSSGNLQFVVQSINDLFSAADKAERTAKEQSGDPIRMAQ